MATGSITVTAGAGTNVATYTISEDAVTKHLYRLVLSNSSGTELGDATTPLVVRGPAAHDAAVSGNPHLIAGYASAAAPSDVSADGDVVRAWCLRNGAQATVLTAAGALIGGDATNGLDVDVTRIIPGTSATSLGKAEDAAHSSGDTGVMALAVRQDTATQLAGTDGDYSPIITDSSGRVHVNVGNTVTVASHAVTNAGTFAVQESGSQVQVDDAAFTPATSKILMVGYEFDDTSPDSVDEGDGGAARMSANRCQYMMIRDAAGNERGANVDSSNRLSVVVGGTLPSLSAGTAMIGSVAGPDAHDAAVAQNPLVIAGRASAAAPSDVSADGDVTRVWCLRSGAVAAVLTAAGALIGGDATNGLDVDVTRLPALAAGTNLIGNVGHGKTCKSKTGSASATFTIVAAVTSKKIKVYSLSLMMSSTTAVTVTFKDGAGGTALGTYTLQAITGTVQGITENVAIPSSLFESSAGTLLEMAFSAAVSVTYNLRYWDDD